MALSFNPGWLKRQSEDVEKSVAEWPAWMKRAANFPEKNGEQMNTTEVNEILAQKLFGLPAPLTQEEMWAEARTVWKVQPGCQYFLMGFTAKPAHIDCYIEGMDPINHPENIKLVANRPDYLNSPVKVFGSNGVVERMREKGFSFIVVVPKAKRWLASASFNHITEDAETLIEAVCRAAARAISK